MMNFWKTLSRTRNDSVCIAYANILELNCFNDALSYFLWISREEPCQQLQSEMAPLIRRLNQC